MHIVGYRISGQVHFHKPNTCIANEFSNICPFSVLQSNSKGYNRYLLYMHLQYNTLIAGLVVDVGLGVCIFVALAAANHVRGENIVWRGVGVSDLNQRVMLNVGAVAVPCMQRMLRQCHHHTSHCSFCHQVVSLFSLSVASVVTT